jgi:hypothetical protein
MKLRAFLIDGHQLDIRPAPLERAWMDATPERFAYRCLPLNIANTFGWEILSPSGFTATWLGEADPASIVVKPEIPAASPVVSHFGSGVLTFHLPCLFRTEPGYDLMVQGPINRPKDGLAALSGIVETDWSPFGFTMNWLFTQPEVDVRFEKGEPFCHIFPVRRGEIECFEPEIRLLSSEPELQQEHADWVESRAGFIAGLNQPGSAAQAQKWQKFYYQNRTIAGRVKASDSHRTRLRLKPFTA